MRPIIGSMTRGELLRAEWRDGSAHYADWRRRYFDEFMRGAIGGAASVAAHLASVSEPR